MIFAQQRPAFNSVNMCFALSMELFSYSTALIDQDVTIINAVYLLFPQIAIMENI